MSQSTLSAVRDDLEAPLRVVLYIRVSTDKQARDGASLETQLEECRRFALDRGWVIVTIYQDVMSGKRADRPEYERMLAARRQYDAVLVWKYDRLGRDEPEFFTTVAELRRHGRDVYSVKEPNGSPIVTGILAVLAAHESRQLAERVRPNLERKAQAGNWISRAPYGYTFVDKHLVIVPEHADVYREMVARYLSGQSLTGIARQLNGRAVPPPRGAHWFSRSIRWMLSSVGQVGDVAWGGQVYPGRHEPLIDRATWQHLQAQLAARAHEPWGNAPATLLSGFLTCRCGYKMSLLQRRRPDRTHRWYRCAARASGSTCDCRHHIRVDDAEAYVVDLLAPLFTLPAAELVGGAVALIRAKADAGGAARERAQLERDIDQARRRLGTAREKLLDGLLTDAEYLEDRSRYQATIDTAQTALAALGSVKAPSLPHLRGLADQIKTLADAWDTFSLERRRSLLTLLGLRLAWDGAELTHTIRRDAALLLGDMQNGEKGGLPEDLHIEEVDWAAD